MNEANQIKAIIRGARNAPSKVGAIVDNYKEERFLKALRAELPETEFDIKSGSFTPGAKAIIITRKHPLNPSNN